MIRHFLMMTVLLSALAACAQKSQKENDYPQQVGDIAFDKNLDNPDFKVCNEKQVHQYYNFGGLRYKGEKPEIVARFKGFKGIEEF